MRSPALRAATASEPLSLPEEYAMQAAWRRDCDKLTFIVCMPLGEEAVRGGGGGEGGEGEGGAGGAEGAVVEDDGEEEDNKAEKQKKKNKKAGERPGVVVDMDATEAQAEGAAEGDEAAAETDGRRQRQEQQQHQSTAAVTATDNKATAAAITAVPTSIPTVVPTVAPTPSPKPQPIIVSRSRGDDADARMLGDVNLFLSHNVDSEAESDAEADEPGADPVAGPSVVGELELMIAEPAARRNGYGRAALLAFLQYVGAHETEIVREFFGETEEETDGERRYSDGRSNGYGNGYRNGYSNGTGNGTSTHPRPRIAYLVAKIAATNTGSIALFANLGFRLVGGGPNVFGEVEMRRDWHATDRDSGWHVKDKDRDRADIVADRDRVKMEGNVDVRELMARFGLDGYQEVEYRGEGPEPGRTD